MFIISQFIFQKISEQIPQRSFILAWEENGLSFADMRWPSAIMKHQLTQQTTKSIRWPHKHTSFPKDWPKLPLRGSVNEDVRQPVGKNKEVGLWRATTATASVQLCLWGLLQKPGLLKSPHLRGEWCGFGRTIVVLSGTAKMRSWLLSSWHSWVMPVFPSQCGHGIPSVLLLCGRIFMWLVFKKWKLFLGCSKLLWNLHSLVFVLAIRSVSTLKFLSLLAYSPSSFSIPVELSGLAPSCKSVPWLELKEQEYPDDAW